MHDLCQLLVFSWITFVRHTFFDEGAASFPKDRARAQQPKGKYVNDPLRPTAICQQTTSYLQCLPKEHNSNEKQIGIMILRKQQFYF